MSPPNPQSLVGGHIEQELFAAINSPVAYEPTTDNSRNACELAANNSHVALESAANISVAELHVAYAKQHLVTYGP